MNRSVQETEGDEEVEDLRQKAADAIYYCVSRLL